MKDLSLTIRSTVQKIIDLAMRINPLIRNDELEQPIVMVDYSGHVQALRVAIFATGYHRGESCTAEYSCYLDEPDCLDTLKKIERILYCILDTLEKKGKECYNKDVEI